MKTNTTFTRFFAKFAVRSYIATVTVAGTTFDLDIKARSRGGALEEVDRLLDDCGFLIKLQEI